MKKTVVTILLVLPFILIYFISFAGRILSTYTHIYVERIAVVDSVGNEYEDNSYIRIDKGEEFDLNIKVFPELASNKAYDIVNSNSSVCSIDENNKVLGLNYGVSKILISSIDRHNVQYMINIEVTHDDIREIIVDKTELTLTKGKFAQIDVSIEPSTTLPENRNLIWESDDTSVANVNNGLIVAVNEGETIVRVKSDHKENVFKEITVKVISESIRTKGVWFKHNSGSIYEVNSTEFNLRTDEFVELVDLAGYSLDDVKFTVEAMNDETAFDINYDDDGYISDGIIIFKKAKTPIQISVSLETDTTEYSDKITIWYIKK